ncbi:MAG: stage II sporulation protein P [Clostridia bacterium]|nr:stage II sporulation protein P [Clostridia bacterium]
MIKKIAKLVLCGVCFVFFIFSTYFSCVNISPNNFYGKTVSYSFGMTTLSLKPQGNNPLPYTYINTQKHPDIPLAIKTVPPFVNQEENNNEENDQTEVDQPDNQEEEKEEIEEDKNSFPVIKLDMSEKQTTDSLLCKNESGYSADINALVHSDYPIKSSKQTLNGQADLPTVLIIHTHGTECYLPDGASKYTPQTPTRSTDCEKNVVAIGRILAETLRNNGIQVIHCETMFDEKSYSDSYNLSEKAVMDYLKKYPSIQYVFDVHRDSIVRQNNEKISPTTEINGKKAAQAMIVVGTDAKGANHPNWRSNLTVASAFQYALVKDYGSLMRPLSIRSASFNAEHSIGSLLLEIGTCGNTLEEASECARLFGNTISNVIKNDGIN